MSSQQPEDQDPRVVIIDPQGQPTTATAPTEGRLVIIGMQGGTRGELDVAALMAKRAAVISTSLRARPSSEKAAICRAVEEHVWPLVADGTILTMVEAEFALDEVGKAHALMESGDHTGKILLRT